MSTVQRLSRSFGTHDGSFHADEVTACALLLLFDLIDETNIQRSRNPDILNRCEFVCDVGGVYDPEEKLFDHHQTTYKGTLSSAGMILEYLKSKEVITDIAYQYFNHALVMGVDAHDNGVDPQIPGYCSFSNVVSNFVPASHEVSVEEMNTAFHDALNFVKGHLRRLWERFLYIQSCRDIVAAEMAKNKECLIFDRGLPWLEAFFEMNGANHPAKFVIMPSGVHWKLRGIPPSYDQRMKVRHPLPQEWAGLLENELKQVSGISGAIFCHKGRFISVWETKEDALKALSIVLGKENS
jgi:uncharacterized UPF0160 family protein